HHLLARAGGLRGARYPTRPHAARAAFDAFAGDRTLVPAADRVACRLLAGLSPQLLRPGPEISRRLVPAREQAASFHRTAAAAGAARRPARPALGGRLFRPDPRRGDLRPDHAAG